LTHQDGSGAEAAQGYTDKGTVHGLGDDGGSSD